MARILFSNRCIERGKKIAGFLFTMTFHPGLPNIRDLLRELHAVLHSSNGCLDAIKEVPMVVFRKRKCLSVEVTGTSKCNSNAD